MFKISKSLCDVLGNRILTLIIFVLILSGSLRLATSTNAALAQGMPDSADLTSESEASVQKKQSSNLNSQNTELSDAKLSILLEKLQDREYSVSERERKMQLKDKKIELSRREVGERLASLETLENSIREMLLLTDEAVETDLAQLTAVYESMKPKDAAKVFEEMEPQFAAGFLSRMRPESAASIFSGLTPEFAYAVSAILASRRTGVPKS
jgi:flagellar motility protein MotE (MotC chaperone)